MIKPTPAKPNRLSNKRLLSTRQERLHLYAVAHVTSALVGSYAFTWGFTSLSMAGLVALGMDFHEAETALMLLAFLVFLPLFLWAFAAANLVRIWVVLFGAAFVMTATAWGLQRFLLT